jgi:hypothetical protein
MKQEQNKNKSLIVMPQSLHKLLLTNTGNSAISLISKNLSMKYNVMLKATVIAFVIVLAVSAKVNAQAPAAAAKPVSSAATTGRVNKVAPAAQTASAIAAGHAVQPAPNPVLNRDGKPITGIHMNGKTAIEAAQAAGKTQTPNTNGVATKELPATNSTPAPPQKN